MFTDPGEVPPLEEQVEALTPGARVGRWRVVERLGVGGQGAVYRVEDLDHPGEFYALKLALQVRDGRAEREQVLLMAQAALLAAARGTEAAWDASLFESSASRPVLPAPMAVPVAPSAPSEPGGARWRRWTGGLGLAAAVLLVLAPRVPPSVCGASEPVATLPTQGKADSVPAQGSQAPRPSQRQKLAPCTAQLELEVSGACWLSLEQRPPMCPPQTVAWQDRCLLPVARPPRAIPTSVEGSNP